MGGNNGRRLLLVLLCLCYAGLVCATEVHHQPHLEIKFGSMRNLTQEELDRIKHHQEREQFLKEHAGHEKMHAEMLFIMMFTIILAQAALFLWSRFFPQSYQTVTLTGMWLVPIVYSIWMGFLRMILAWTLFTSITMWVIFKATRRPIAPSVPRMVYSYFYFVYKLSYIVGILGYLMLLADIFGAGKLLSDSKHSLMQMGLMVLFYALYFGVLARDFAEICASRMASTIGYYSPKGIPLKSPTTTICAICGDSFKAADVERVFKLSCDHVFHEFCIRGWCIVGKKQTCPFCKEKVDLKAMFPSPWIRQDVIFSAFLDGVRYLVVWQPAILAMVQVIIWSLDLK